MEDFTKGKIYKIINFTDKQIYVGSTVYSLSERMMGHGTKYKMWKRRKGKEYYSSFILFENHGFDNCKMVLLENFCCSSKKELIIREEFYRQMNINFCVNKNACYQTRIGGIKKIYEWQEKNKGKVKIYKNKSKKKNAERYICECGLSLQLGSKPNHLKSKRHQDLLLKNQEKVSNRGGKTSHLKTKKHQKYLLKLSRKYDIQLKKFIKDYKKYVKLRETFELKILTFTEFYFKVYSINKK